MILRDLAGSVEKQRRVVHSIIWRKMPDVQKDVLEDAFSDATLYLLENHTQINPSDVFPLLCRKTFDAVHNYFEDIRDHHKYVIEGRRHYDSIDWSKLDPRFRNQLTDMQKRIFDARVKKIPPRDMHIDRTGKYINVVSYGILSKYRRWVKTIHPVKQKFIDALPAGPAKDMLQLYIAGYTSKSIAKMLHTPHTRIASLICYYKKNYFKTL